ncbi:putative inactive purple acid phosphatase 24 [Morella rubra]|uniref:Putative inactive purple acid phosphatase 24 n=1 Tax=Morella rubra TaxID=262757 RepID=A0A6A1VTK1_9ROSI|nr:putative inactive purple acid phosphatase 24 [Morella rubra]
MDRVLDHFDLDYTRHEDVRTVVETMMTARRTHRNRMHAYFKKFLSKEAALLKPHPDTTEEQWKELCDLFTSEAFMKRSEQNKKNRSKLTVNHAAGSRSFQRTRACMHQLAKARDEIEAMRAAREKDLQEFAKKQAEMEATLRDHREEQRVEQERIGWSRGAHEKGARAHASGARGAHATGTRAHAKEQERLRAEISKETGEENERHVKATIQPVWGFKKPKLIAVSNFISFANPKAPLYPALLLKGNHGMNGNHECDGPDTGSFYENKDSGGECGVLAETMFYVPAENSAKFW